MTMQPSIAVIFRTHFWDDFCQRQLIRLRQVADGTDIFILVDETHGPVTVADDAKLVRVTDDSLLALGLARAGEGALLWFNGDYPLYGFIAEHPGYDYYLQLEYDVLINRPIAGLIADIARQNLDYVGLTKQERPLEWFWLHTMLGAYPRPAIRNQLICLCIFSNAALRHLSGARLAQSEAWRAGDLVSWPFCEGFIPTELHDAGFACAELSAFGRTEAYDHWPPYLESDIAGLAQEEFVHPVLDPERYVASMQKYHVGLSGYLNPNSQFHRKLRRLPPRAYVAALCKSFLAKSRRSLRQMAARLVPARAASQGVVGR